MARCLLFSRSAERRGKPGKTARSHDGDLDRTCAPEGMKWCEVMLTMTALPKEEKMRALTLLVALMAALMLAAPPSYAIPVPLSATLSGPNEVPAVASPGTGQAFVKIDAAAHTLLVNATFSGLVGTTTASHIHCCQPLGTNAIVATTVPTFPGFPLGVTAGSYSHLFDLTDSGTYNPAFVTQFGGGTIPGAETALVAGLLGGRSYFNIHTTFATGGEIRGQLQVPDAASLLLL